MMWHENHPVLEKQKLSKCELCEGVVGPEHQHVSCLRGGDVPAPPESGRRSSPEYKTSQINTKRKKKKKRKSLFSMHLYHTRDKI